ncbi:MAG: hypothetical protein KDI71_09140 [Xanthomonadales bacterium]|nr:hypothetical protein [Xanthomonadales bacterium]
MKARWLALLALGWTSFASIPAHAADESGHPLGDIPLRSIGPALTSGRVADFAFHPEQPQTWYVAMASAGLWKTVNHGTTWTPLFDSQGSFALGVVALSPHDPNVVWVGTGENNSQRSVGFGDGVYRSLDGGKSWKNMGLKDSAHIGAIRFHPTDPNVIYVAAMGPLWNSGGDRGLYRSDDGGDSWERILEIDQDTGIYDFALHPDDPDVIVASSYQRRRHVWTLINGGPGGGIHKTLDGGKTWRKIGGGLPGGDLGKIGITAAPSEPAMLYAIIEADAKGRGTYRSKDFGESWEKRSGYASGGAQYYHELIVDPNDADRVYSMDTFTQVSEDGGKSFSPISFVYKHVDDHAMWIDPNTSDHFFIGGDGGIYETWDRGQTWRHVTNLPTVQYYRATPDNDVPFYNVCAGTQDNHSHCGPSQTRFTDGITNADWWIAQFGDGFKPQSDPSDPNTVYAQYQHGGLIRMDRVSGERTSIAPVAPEGQLAYNWNWNTPLIISPHSSSRLYMGAERLLRSDDRGNSWREVSPDLTRQLDRNQLEVMGRVWSVDAIAKNASTSIYGALIAIAESPITEGLLFVGTDDGLIQVSENGGESWRRSDRFATVPEMSLIEDLIASHHDDNVVYMVVDNHKRGDHKPYVLKSSDRGNSWRLIVKGLPDRGAAHTIIEDHVSPNLLFVGTEFGLYFSVDGGGQWQELSSLPTIAVRDLEIQRRENDLVVGTFGRGIYILDDYTPLRTAAQSLKSAEATLFAVRDAWRFLPDNRRGWGGLGDWGNRYAAENPPYGAVFSYYLPESLETAQQKRQKAEQALAKEGKDTPYPSWDALRAEDAEEAPSLTFTVRDENGNVVARVNGPTSKGFHRVAWDLRYSAPDPVNLTPPAQLAPWQSPPQGPLAVAGSYSVSLSKRHRGVSSELAGPVSFRIKPLFGGKNFAEDQAAVLSFQQNSAELVRTVTAAIAKLDEIDGRINHLLKAVELTGAAGETQASAIRAIQNRSRDLRTAMTGDASLNNRYARTPTSIAARVGGLQSNWGSQADVTTTDRQSYAIAKTQLDGALTNLSAVEQDLRGVEQQLEQLGAPGTPGRLPQRR